ncbi:MAG: hypothetical protein JO026_00100 [Patescibacteria group bacterium]|nr:hypothetical protein [Patescibacteria group bacterium]
MPLLAQAATLSLTPGTATLAEGDTVTLAVRVESSDQQVNAVSARLSIPDNFSVVSLSKENSVINFWTTEPEYSNGEVSFEGVILNPGYQGAGRTALTMTLKAKSPGDGNVSFVSGSVLANDGNGSEVLKGMSGATLHVGVAATQIPPSTALPTSPQKAAPGQLFTISSPTFPDQTMWYATTTGTFVFGAPKNATATRILLDQSQNGEPSVTYSSPLSQKRVSALPEGISYLHVQYKENGSWGPVESYKIQIDLTPPLPFAVIFPKGASGFEPTPVIAFNATDTLSGIDHYTMQIDGKAPLDVSAEEAAKTFTLPAQSPGPHTIVVTAFDRAGNSTLGEAGFFVAGVSGIVINYLALGLLIALVLLGALFLGYLLWRRFKHLLIDVTKETGEAESVLHKSFTLLKKDIHSHADKLERAKKTRALTTEETDFLTQFEQELSEAEHIIEDKLEDIPAP